MRKLNNVVIVTGVSASGKDYLLSRALAQIDTNTPITHISLGAEIYLLAQKEANCVSRDALQQMSASVVRRFALRVLNRAVKLEGIKVINTHVAYRQDDLIVSDPITDLEIQARDYIFIAADPTEIAARRKADATRQRREESIEMITIHQEIALATAMAVARVQQSGLTIIKNTPETTKENVVRIQSVIAAVCRESR